MGKEIERKYVVDQAAWKPQDAGTHFKQGYLNSQKERVVRVRIDTSGTRCSRPRAGWAYRVEPGAFKRFVPPGIPVNGVLGMLTQIGGSLVSEAVRHVVYSGFDNRSHQSTTLEIVLERCLNLV